MRGCGPDDLRFDVKTIDSKDGVTRPDAAKASVYFVGEVAEYVACVGGCASTVRIGLDGTWIGAIKGDSYLFFAVEPGEHHLCSGWQVHHRWTRKSIAAVTMRAEPGKIYYFLTKIHYGIVDPLRKGPFVELQSIDNAEGQALISSRKLSTFRPKT